MEITGFEIEQYEVDTTPFRWRNGLNGSSGGKGVETLLRVKTSEEVDGLVWLSNDCRSVSRALIQKTIAPKFLGADPLMREKIWYEIWEMDRIEEFPIYVLGYLDVALWDIAAKKVGVPLYQLLGGHKKRAKAYASTVTKETTEDYLRLADRCMERGYKAMKLHVWGDAQEDIRLVRALRRHVGPKIELMLDGSGAYSLEDSIRLGRTMEDEDYLWLEEPMREFNLYAYEKLCSVLDISILAAETTDGCHFNAGEWIRHGACDRVRTSWLFKGGFTGALKVAHLAESFQLQADVHGCDQGCLQLVCALPNSVYYEALVPEECNPEPTLSGAIVPDQEGWVYPSELPGIGWDPDPKKRVR